MGLIDSIQNALGSTEDEQEATYTCQSCGATFKSERDSCNICDGTKIVQES